MNNARPALLLVTASLLPALVLASVMGWFFINEQQQGLDADLRDRAAILAGALDRELNTQIQLLSIVADSPRLDLPVSRTSFAETARRLKDQVAAWQQIRVSNDEGEVVLAYPPLSVSASREVVDLESHKRVIETGMPVVGNIAIGKGGKAAFAVRVPVRRKDRLRAVLSVVIRPETITQMLYASGLPNDWSAWVVDSQERLVATTSSPELAAMAATEFARPQDDLFMLSNGNAVRVAEAQIGATTWRVKIGLPASQYNRPAMHAVIFLVGAGLITILLSGIVAVLLYREMRSRAAERESLANWQRMDALGKLTGQAAHDFNNLLMVFQAGVDGIERRRGDEERVTRLLGNMRQGVNRGKTITRRLLSFARRSNQGAEHLDLEAKIAEMTPLLQQALNDSVLLDIRIPNDVWGVHADPVGLEISLINLLTNAREAMADGGNVVISARNVDDGVVEDKRLKGPVVALTVTDTGRGVAAAELTRIFEPFYSTKDNGGPGLGLTQVLGFAEGNGGTARATSLAGQGSAVTLYLPKSLVERAPKVAEANIPGMPAHILIVDDTPASLEAARTALEDAVTSIRTAKDGTEALALIEKHPQIDAVLSDIMMPGMSGIELADRIGQLRPRLPVVLMTGYSDKLEAGAKIVWPIVMKPFEQSEIVKALTSAHLSAPDLTNIIKLDVHSKS
ncbi:response regulator [Neorhizobium sp. JUb45]|uniref:response regulator n=1 Tax=unclassified Neorhizobium TaxID=2629175 RepID=UPI0010E696B3|nr:response regulator [Neorhizobium sp. JUb45]TCQ98188.1 histidine kinase/DNA gyrase B/HSP90-like ATPase [Neorhizobium sp. JUb45]